jgi:hypothetical protein
MAWIYLLESIQKKDIKTSPPPPTLFVKFFCHRTDKQL